MIHLSQSELQRFAAAFQADPSIAMPYGSATGPDELAALMRADGFDVTDEEVRSAQDSHGELPDELLDQVSGGFAFLLPVIAAFGAVALASMIVGGTVAAFTSNKS